MRVLLLLLALGVLIIPVSGLTLVEFCPDTYVAEDADEYVVLEGEGVLDGFTVSDGEGGFRFPVGSGISGRIIVARQGAAYQKVHGESPDYEIYDTSPAIADVVRGGRFQMSNTRDELLLYQEGVLVQRIAWPDELTTREGQVHYLENGRWDPRPLFIGQSRFSPLTVDNVTLTAFVSPDGSFTVFSRVIVEAEKEIWVNVYEFSSSSLSALLLDAHQRGVNLSLLLEGGPVGGITAEEHCAMRALADEGILLRQMQTEGDTHAKYQFDHAKYVIVDDAGVLLSSENFNDNGIPPPGRSGNRGWGVYIRDERIASYFRQIFSWDIQGNDVLPFSPGVGVCNGTDSPAYTVEFSPQEFSGARVTVVLAPDTSALITGMIAGAQKSVEIEQAYIKNYSGNTPNPYLEEAFAAARRGVQVRVLLDSSWFNINEPRDNDEMASYINARGRNEGIPISARCADLKNNNLDKIHNKGVIVDGNQVLVSSINWNEQSPSFNRESGVIIEHPGAGAYYRAVFEDDWNASTDTAIEGPDITRIIIAILVVLALTGVYFFRIRR
ncbi:MAG: phospholipase D-like domain-containing protein [Methanomicrobiales archaeon]|nr:phospholipase D-like domain-containing protein [Methanomicrobiales archaeon]